MVRVDLGLILAAASDSRKSRNWMENLALVGRRHRAKKLRISSEIGQSGLFPDFLLPSLSDNSPDELDVHTIRTGPRERGR